MSARVELWSDSHLFYNSISNTIKNSWYCCQQCGLQHSGISLGSFLDFIRCVSHSQRRAVTNCTTCSQHYRLDNHNQLVLGIIPSTTSIVRRRLRRNHLCCHFKNMSKGQVCQVHILATQIWNHCHNCCCSRYNVPMSNHNTLND